MSRWDRAIIVAILIVLFACIFLVDALLTAIKVQIVLWWNT